MRSNFFRVEGLCVRVLSSEYGCVINKNDEVIKMLGRKASKMLNIIIKGIIISIFMVSALTFTMRDAYATLETEKQVVEGAEIPMQSFDDIKVYVDGIQVEFPDQKPYIDKNSRTLIPVRFVSESLGANVAWFEEIKTVDIINSKARIMLKIGERNCIKDGKEMEMDTEVVVTNGRTMVPVRFVSEALGADVRWVIVNNHGIVFNFTKGQTEEEIQRIVERITLQMQASIHKTKAQREFEKLPDYNIPKNEGLQFHGVGYTVEKAAQFAYDFLHVRTNYDAADVASMDAWVENLSQYYTTLNQEGLGKTKETLIKNGSKASSTILLDSSKIRIEGGRFYVAAIVTNNEDGTVYRADIRIGGHDARPSDLGVGILKWTEIE